MANNDISQTQALFNNNGVNFSNNKKYFRYNNFFFTIADAATVQLYVGYLTPCLEAYDGFIWGCHDETIGLLPQGMLQAAAQTLKRKIFKHGIDFDCRDTKAYMYLNEWKEKSQLLDKLQTAFIYMYAGGTALFVLNGVTKDSGVGVFRIDKFLPQLTNLGNMRRFFTFIQSIQDKKGDYWVLTEERFMSGGKAYREFKYYRATTLVNQNLPADWRGGKAYSFKELPDDVQEWHTQTFGKKFDIGKKDMLPFTEGIGARLIKYNEGIPGMEHLGLGQPVPDIGLQDSFNYDMSFQFGAIERFVARPRVLVPSGFVNRNVRNGLNTALNNVFYENYTLTSDSDTKPQEIAFPLRASDIKVDRETVLQNFAMKLGCSADLLADWASHTGGTSGTSATAIIKSDKKTDNYVIEMKRRIECEINLLLPEILKEGGFKNVEAKLCIYPENTLDFATEAQTVSMLYEKKMLPPDITAGMIGRQFDRRTREHIQQYMEDQEDFEILEKQAQILQSISSGSPDGDSDYDGKTDYNNKKSRNAEADRGTGVNRNMAANTSKQAKAN